MSLLSKTVIAWKWFNWCGALVVTMSIGLAYGACVTCETDPNCNKEDDPPCAEKTCSSQSQDCGTSKDYTGGVLRAKENGGQRVISSEDLTCSIDTTCADDEDTDKGCAVFGPGNWSCVASDMMVCHTCESDEEDSDVNSSVICGGCPT